MDTELKRKLAAILVADVVGYSRLVADDEEATLRRLEVFRALWQDCLAKTGGRIFNTAGDAVLAEFQSAVEAVRCALEFQAQAKTQNDSLVPKRQMHFRIGITIGDVVERRGDLLGDGVNIAARLQTLAGPGGICVSSWVREAVANKLLVGFTDLGDQQVKNIPGPIRAYLVGTGATAQAAAAPPAVGQPQGARPAARWAWIGGGLGVVLAGLGGFLWLGPWRTPTKPVAVVVEPRPPEPPKTQPKSEPKSEPAQKQEVRPKQAQPPPAPKKEEEKRIEIVSPNVPQEPLPPTTPQQEEPKLTPQPTPQLPQPQPPADPVRRGRLTEEDERALRPGDRFKECETCPEMIVIPSGAADRTTRYEFTMGSRPSQPGHETDEAPERRVTIGARLAVGVYPVTVAEYETFVALNAYQHRPPGCRTADHGDRWVNRPELSFRNPGFPQSPSHPVVCVNWDDAKAFAHWMRGSMKANYRLPTEAEREYFTRAGTTTAFWWGNDIDPSRAVYDWSETFGNSWKKDAPKGTMPVATFAPNPWGLYQVHGNVAEWVEDCWNDSYRGAPSDGSAWLTGDCSRRMLRGASWGNTPKELRSAYREAVTLEHRNFNFSFRIVRELRK